MSDFNFTIAAVSVTSHERKSARLESTYDALVSHLSLSVDTTSEDMTAAARSIVVTGANNDGTATGKTLTADDLTGRDPGAGVRTRDYWKAARAVRIGLVSATKRAAGEGEPSAETDYLALIVKAVEAGKKHSLTADAIKAAVESVL